MDEYYFQMIYNLSLVKICYDYDKKRTMAIFGKMPISSGHPEYFMTDCYKVVSSDIRYFINEQNINPMTNVKSIEIMVFKHPAIEKCYGLYNKVKQLGKKKYANALRAYIRDAEKELSCLVKCIDGASISLRKNKYGTINRFYLEKFGYIMDYSDSLYCLMDYVSTLEEGYLVVSDMLYDKGVVI